MLVLIIHLVITTDECRLKEESVEIKAVEGGVVEGGGRLWGCGPQFF